jgi:DNA excision repair protein ERCC-5
LLTIAQPCDIEQLHGKVLAIDASIWIVKIDTSYGSNAEKIKSILSKIVLLKRNNILPVFVFDGMAPVLKRRTLEERSRKRLVSNDMEARKRSEIEIMRMI